MQQTKTETNIMVYKTNKIEEHILYKKSIFYIRKYVLFVVFVVLGWMSKHVFKHEAYI